MFLSLLFSSKTQPPLTTNHHQTQPQTPIYHHQNYPKKLPPPTNAIENPNHNHRNLTPPTPLQLTTTKKDSPSPSTSNINNHQTYIFPNPHQNPPHHHEQLPHYCGVCKRSRLGEKWELTLISKQYNQQALLQNYIFYQHLKSKRLNFEHIN